MSPDERQLEFSQANQAFSQANKSADANESQKLYEQAILRYEKIIDDGRIKNGKLYYNLANAYLLKGDIGKAILNYRRAQELDNSNPDIYKNYLDHSPAEKPWPKFPRWMGGWIPARPR